MYRKHINITINKHAEVIILNKLKSVKKLSNLPGKLEDYKIREAQDLLPEEKEVHLNMLNGKSTFHADKRTAVKWAIERLKEGEAELDYLYYSGNKIYSIGITVSHNFIAFKSVPRKSDSISSCFS